MVKEVIFALGIFLIPAYAVLAPVNTEPAEPVIVAVREYEHESTRVVSRIHTHEEIIEEVEVIDIYDEPVEELSLSDEEIDLIALITMAEAEGEPEEGQRLVIDTILNRVDSGGFPDTVNEVIYQPSQFSSVWDGRADRCYVMDDIRQLVLEELETRTDSEVVFFRTERYSSFGTPMFQVGNHYFSKS